MRDMVRIRSASIEDAERLGRMLLRLTAEAVYMRFGMARVTAWMPACLAGVGDSGGRALVAAVGDEVVGHAMYGRPENGAAEVAVVVEDGWQSAGVGRLLFHGIAEEAQGRGVEVFVCASLAGNRRVWKLLNAAFDGFEHEMRDGMRVVRAPLARLKPRKPGGGG